MAAVNLGQPASLSQGPISQDDASEILGSISMAAFLCLLIPQLVANYKLKSADSLSMAFLFIWLLGDVTNLLGGLANGIAPASIAVTTYLCFSDSTLICQCLYYNSKRRIRNLVQPSTPRSQSPERRPLLEPADSSEDVNSPSHYEVASPGSTQVVDKDEENDISTVRTLHDWRFNAACLVMVAILGISGWFVLRQFGVVGGEKPPGAVSVTELSGISESVGSALGIIGAICYLCARIPQIIKNYRGKSCEGLAPLFLLLSVTGNLTYGMSVIAYKQDREYLLTSLPWLMGSLGTIVEDGIILFQVRLYSRVQEPVDSNGL